MTIAQTPARADADASANTLDDGGTPVADSWRSNGMRELDPEAMRRFRRVEREFLSITGERGFEEIRTPTIEPLHLYTTAGALSPELLDRAYSFLDWDGWSGERVVLRPDATVPAARWFAGSGRSEARVSYVEPVYRFEPGDADRELWQCGVELFGPTAAEGDPELLRVALDLLEALGLEDRRVDLAHAGLIRAVLAAAGLDPTAQIAAYDRMLEGDASLIEELSAARPEGAGALRLLADVDGDSVGYVANLRTAMLPVVPAAAQPLAELEGAARALDALGASYRIVPGTASSFEYYSGLTFRITAGGVSCISGGRYDGLTASVGGSAVPASGFAASLSRLATLVANGGAA
ncbi:MAG: ATP phosphoribosyltransferase regulatory subunit [Chloroflexi bacterium]|nr:ATP phosphoribosyltransferase regulatory subunit [Chloroflexota bacterium]MDA1148353.1 ATP phosphoribosyltransferase regulatory subunit [Chloroflexota bacterium]MQC82566.1 ATP phosphoribosyltransferase regulatory subunit [Chloroflexota bacterium]